MIIGDNREIVIANIARSAESGRFQDKVEPGDPALSSEQRRTIVENYLNNRNSCSFKIKAALARQLANAATKYVNKDTQIVGLDKLENLSGGAILTCNHFSPVDNTVVRHLIRSLGKKRINILSQVSNFAMPGLFGFLMNYADTIPLGTSKEYLCRQLPEIMETLLKQGEYILIYPEQEMWFNYRKPRPTMRGAYYYAAKLQVPVVSCFVEMRDLEEQDTTAFQKVQYRLHILAVLQSDPALSERENSILLCQEDYELKKTAYEQIYGKPLTYEFESADIAGWNGVPAV